MHELPLLILLLTTAPLLLIPRNNKICGKMAMKKPNFCVALKLFREKGMERPKGLSLAAEPQVTTPVGLLCSMYTNITDIMIIIKAHIN